METESQAKIAIRGKGSVKEGKGRSDAAHTSNQEEDLHCLIMADTEEKVNKAKKLIHNIIETVCAPACLLRGPLVNIFQAASIPEGQNELKRNQLRELAALNGTLRDDENQACQNCGQIGHRKYDCPEQRNFTANIICRVCGNAGHMARDCPDRQRGADWRNGPPAPAGPGGFAGRPAAGRIGAGDAVDREYEVRANSLSLLVTYTDIFKQLMQELSGGAPAPTADAPHRIEAGPGGFDQGPPAESGDMKPWQRGPTGAAAPWQQRGRGGDDYNNHRDSAPTGGAAPWARDNRGPRNDYRGGRNDDRGDRRGNNDYYGGGHNDRGHDNGYGAPPPPPPVGGAAPWQSAQAAPPAAPAAYGGYGGYAAPGYGAPAVGGYPPPPPAMGAPPGLGAPPGAPPGLGALLAQFAGSPPPPPPGGAAPPPPPPGGAAPPPPPSDQPPPPPPPAY